MSVTRTSSVRRTSDHFEPETALDPQAQRRLRGHIEQIDYTAYASNREVIAQVLGQADTGRFQKLAVAVALARATWAVEALALTETPHPLTPEQTARLAGMRASYEELAEAYEGLRRMVERGYLNFPS